MSTRSRLELREVYFEGEESPIPFIFLNPIDDKFYIMLDEAASFEERANYQRVKLATTLKEDSGTQRVYLVCHPSNIDLVLKLLVPMEGKPSFKFKQDNKGQDRQASFDAFYELLLVELEFMKEEQVAQATSPQFQQV